jgi:hypothetical protein
MPVVYPHYGHRAAVEALKNKQRAQLAQMNQITIHQADLKKAQVLFEQLYDNKYNKYWTGQPLEPPEYKLLHKLGSVHVYKVTTGINCQYVARLLRPGEEKKEFIAPSPKLALRGLRKYLPKSYKRKSEFVAYRCWKIKNGYLRPVTTAGGEHVVFTGPILQAHEAPKLGNQAGLYSVSRLNTDWLRGEYDHDAFGEVGCYGRVIEHERGYRSEYQVVRSITLCEGEKYPDWFLKGLADTYECEVTVGSRSRMRDIKEMMEYYNAIMTPKLMPPPPPPPPLSQLTKQIMQPGSIIHKPSLLDQMRALGLI